MTNVVKLKRKIRPLRKTYSPSAPYTVERIDHDDGYIAFDVVDERPESYRFVCGISEHECGQAKWQAEQIARGLNMLVQYGMEKLPEFRDDD